MGLKPVVLLLRFLQAVDPVSFWNAEFPAMFFFVDLPLRGRCFQFSWGNWKSFLSTEKDHRKRSLSGGGARLRYRLPLNA